jgi:hypothetical protein
MMMKLLLLRLLRLLLLLLYLLLFDLLRASIARDCSSTITGPRNPGEHTDQVRDIALHSPVHSRLVTFRAKWGSGSFSR